MHKALGAEKEEDVLLLNAPTAAVKEANKASIGRKFHPSCVDWVFET